MTALLNEVQTTFGNRRQPADRQLVAGVDTHQDSHTVAAVDVTGRLLATETFPATAAGYAALLSWLAGRGTVRAVGIEGTSSYGSGLAEFLHARGVDVVEVDRPDRATRRRHGKPDPVDAEAAARAVLTGRATGTPKRHRGPVESIRVLRVARSSARDALRPDLAAAGDPSTATKIALRRLARRHATLTAEIADLDTLLQPLIEQANPRLLRVHGIGPEVAAQLLTTARDNPRRLHSEAAFAMLCGSAPLPASSGKTNRHRLNGGGDRQANNALWRIALCRMKTHAPTRAYVTRRTTEGLSKPEIIRCIKRYISREIYPLLTDSPD